jgi:hypothetical protein
VRMEAAEAADNKDKQDDRQTLTCAPWAMDMRTMGNGRRFNAKKTKHNS